MALIEKSQAAIEALMHFDTGMGIADSFFGRQYLEPVFTKPDDIIPTDGTKVFKAKELVIDQTGVRSTVCQTRIGCLNRESGIIAW